MAVSKKSKGSSKLVKKTKVAEQLDLGDDLKTTELKLAKGAKREYIVTELSPEVQLARNKKSSTERILFSLLLLLLLFLRLYKLAQPDSVVFDEVHFGGFARKYILGTYFMDVHPPLAKMLYAGVGFIFGFTGDFEFKNIGDKFPESVPYTLMRLFSALCGVGTIFTFYNTLRLSGCKPIVALASSSLLLIENSYFTISRYILLDLPLIFFISCAAYSLKRSETDTPFTFDWYKSLASTGVSLGLALSSKWVGLFTVAWVGLLTVWNLWFVVGDISVKPCALAKQIVAKLFFLLAVPLTLYLYFFSVHFKVLNKEGDGSAFLSAPFRSTLLGNKLPRDILADVGVGSKITLRHLNTQGGYLHSHNHLLETGSQQQQITLYPHLDDNNIFEIELYNVTEYPTEFVPITDGTKIRLKHSATQRRLHSHDHKPPVSESSDWQKEVSAYGFEGFEGDPNDDFIVEIVASKSKKGEAQHRVRAIETVFRLRHAMTGCLLFSHDVKLPLWGFEQQEVTCASQGIDSLLLWSVEQNENEFLPLDLERVNYEAPSFWSKFLESHIKMWKINQGLTDSHAWESSPDSWPLLLRGINYWVKDNTQVYLFGNLVTWYGATLAIVAFVVYVAIQALRWQRGYQIATSPDVFNFNVQTFHYILGWLLHYFPSFLMGRQLFLHHYLPLYYFGILALGQTLELIHSHVLKARKQVSYMLLIVIVSCAASCFLKYSSLIKGDPWTKQKCQSAKLLSSWDFDCNAFLDSPNAYESLSSSIHQAQQTSAVDFEAAIPVEQNEDFELGKVVLLVDEQKIPESDEPVAFDSAVEVEETIPEQGSQSAEAVEQSTVGELENVDIDSETLQTVDEEASRSIELLKRHVTTSLPNLQLGKNKVEEPIIVKKDGKLFDKNNNEIEDPEVLESVRKMSEDFPMDKLTLQQMRKKGDNIGTVV